MKRTQMLESDLATNLQMVAKTPSCAAYHPVFPPHTAEKTTATVFKECLKNHAVGLGGHALDGCGEFMPSSTEPTDPGLMKCAACGCHRNFHRQVAADQNHYSEPPPPHPLPMVGVTPPHFLLLPLRFSSSPSTSTPPPSSPPRQLNHPAPPPPAAAHMLMVLATGKSASPPPSDHPTDHHRKRAATTNSSPTTRPFKPSDHHQTRRKRFRSKFSSEQKAQMRRLAEGLNWKLHKHHDKLVADFCADVGVSKGVLKVWIHNNKNTVGKIQGNPNDSGNNHSSSGNNGEDDKDRDQQLQLSNSEHHQQVDEGNDGLGLGLNHHHHRLNHRTVTID